MERSVLLNCYYSVIKYVCKVYKIDYIQLFMLSVGIKYVTNQKKIYDKLKPNMYMTLEEFFSDLYGLKISYINDIKQYENNNIKIAKIDSFECPWSKAYHINHIEHYIIVNSICIEKEYVICSDPYQELYNIKIDIKKFKKALINTRIINGNKIIKNYKNNLVEIYIKRNSKKIIYKNYELFIRDVNVTNKIEEFFECSDVMNCKLVISAKQIENNWIGVCEYIKLNGHKNELFSIAKECANMWSGIALILIKCRIKNCWTNKERQNIIENLKECCKLEGTLYDKFTEEYIGLNI